MIKSLSFSLNEVIKINKLNNAINIDKEIKELSKDLFIKMRMVITKIDLTKTLNLKTAIIEKECIRSLNIDIFEGP